MVKKVIASGLILGSFFWGGTPVIATVEQNLPNEFAQRITTNRLYGNTRYETARVISEHYSNTNVKNIILTTGNEFADALSASVFAYEKEAPILLVDSSVDQSQDALDYLGKYLDPTGTVYIIGGPGVIGLDFELKLKALGYMKVVRIAGLDRYGTSYKIANSLLNPAVSTVVISSGEQYPDALSISSFAANKGWPILLTPHDTLTSEVRNYLKEKEPSKIYITGGTGAIIDSVSSEIRDLLPQASVERLTGETRFDTNIQVAETFAPKPSAIYLTTGYDFADALAGSALAAKNGDPIIFVDPSEATLPKAVVEYFEKLKTNNLYPKLVSFGGNAVVSEELMNSSSHLIAGDIKGTSIYSIADRTESITQNQTFTLPKTVSAKLYNSDTIECPVQWNLTSVNTSKIGESVYTGVVEGYDKAIKLVLNVTEPAPKLLAEYKTYFDASLINRSENIRLASSALNGLQLAPGEAFSFNKSVGERTTEAGYKEALIIEGNSFIPGLGGGICQVSSTLYNVVLLADLEVLERHPHSLPISYVPPGQDATVAYPFLDFKFKNSSDAPLIIRSHLEENSVTFQFFRKMATN